MALWSNNVVRNSAGVISSDVKVERGINKISTQTLKIEIQYAIRAIAIFYLFVCIVISNVAMTQIIFTLDNLRVD